MGVSTPQGWLLEPVETKGNVTTGKALAARAPGKLRPYLRTKNVFDGRIVTNDVLTMPMTDAEFKRYRVLPGDVLLNEGQSLELVGRCAVYRDENMEPCAMQNQLLRFRARPGVSAEFAAHLFRYLQQEGTFARIALQTTSIAHLGATRLEKLKLLWPERETEQDAIAEALCDMDLLIESLETLIAKKRAVRHGAIQQLLTGRTRLPGFSGAWTPRPLSAVAEIRNDKVQPPDLPAETPCVELEHIERRHGRLLGCSHAGAARSTKYRFAAGDVLFGRLRPYLRKFWLADRDGICTTEIWPLTVRKQLAHRTFLRALVETEEFIAAACASYGTHMPRADWRVVGEVEFNLPSPEEQQAIGAMLFDMNDEIETLENRLAKTSAIKQGAMQQLLTGRIRLPLDSEDRHDKDGADA